jgi:hypothetical protein
MRSKSMKPRLIPLTFPCRDADFDQQLTNLHHLFDEYADILEPIALGSPLPEAEAVVFPQVLGDAYRHLVDFKAIHIPILFITSEFGTVSMWDWEIRSYLRAEGVETLAPYNLQQARLLCKSLAVKRALQHTKFLVYQDNPGEGFQPSIFKRFYWWENECIQRMQERFGLTVVKKSFRDLGAAAKEIPDQQAQAAWRPWQNKLNIANISERALLSAVKIYLAVKGEIERDPAIQAVGINCLNESQFSDTTPCLAWAMLHEEIDLTWGCEADLVSMLTQHLLHRCIGQTEAGNIPLMMTNLYPFLMGQAALKHERIPYFPTIEQPENHILAAHCGYLGVLPGCYAVEWALRKKVLAIVDSNATAIDARLAPGEITLVKLAPDFWHIMAVESHLTGYAQYQDSDCLNGAVIRVPDGHKLMDDLFSHHYVIMAGHCRSDIELLGKVFGLEMVS